MSDLTIIVIQTFRQNRGHQKPDSGGAGEKNVLTFVQRYDGGEVVTYTVILHCFHSVFPGEFGKTKMYFMICPKNIWF